MAISGQLRHDVTTDEWVVVAEAREGRPYEFTGNPRPALSSPETCPFCPGNEHETPREVLRHPTDPWSVRIVPNRFPAFTEGPPPSTTDASSMVAARGAQEVLIETPRHGLDFADLTDAEVTTVFSAYAARLRTLMERAEVETVVFFKNHGPCAGASLEHSHSQIVATSFVPPQLRRRVDRAATYRQHHGNRFLMQDLAEQAARDGERGVIAHETAIVFAPFAPRFAFETWVVPRQPEPSPTASTDVALEGVAKATRDALACLRRTLGSFDFNFAVMSAPSKTEAPGFSWFVRIMPRLGHLAGFELSTDTTIVTVSPERAARRLRAVLEP